MLRSHARFTALFALLALLVLTLRGSHPLVLAASEPAPDLVVTEILAASEPAPDLAQSSFKIVGVIWEDVNCDGIRQDDEPLKPHVRITLRFAGEEGLIDGDDPDIQETAPLYGNYAFTYAAPDEPYFMSIRGEYKPLGYVPAPFRQGDDPTRDNDLTLGLLPGTPLWATPVFWMPADGSQVTGIDIGLCKLPTVYLPLVKR